MSIESEASFLLREIVSPPHPGESVKALIYRASRAVGFSAIRVKKLWYLESKAVLALEMDRLREVAARKIANGERSREKFEQLSREVDDIRQRLTKFYASHEGADFVGASEPLDEPIACSFSESGGAFEEG